MKNTVTPIAIQRRFLTVNEKSQLSSVKKRAARINNGEPEEGDRDPGRLFADVEFLLALINASEIPD